jgi:prepilin-type N-terminal cleavage/methylation domain-containing protein
MTISQYACAAKPRQGFTLIEIMVSLMIFVVVSGAMVSILMISSDLFRRGEFSRSANDETIAVLGAVSDDLNHMVPENSDGWFFAGIPRASGNTLVSFTTAGQSPDGIGARGQNARSLVGLWVEETPDQEPRLRRIVLDDSRGILDFISSLVIASGKSSVIVTAFQDLEVFGYDTGGDSTKGYYDNDRSKPIPLIEKNNPLTDWYGRQVMREIANFHNVADIQITFKYNWRLASGTLPRPGIPSSGTRDPFTLVIPSSVLTQGCLHFSCWVALNDIPGMQRPKDKYNQPDWEQLDANTGTRLGPWGPTIRNSSQSAEVYDTRPKGWIPPAQNVVTLTRKPPFPAAIRLSFVLTGGGRFAPKGILQSDLTDSVENGDLRYSGFTGLPSTPGSMLRVDDEWIAYTNNVGGRLYYPAAPALSAAEPVYDGPGRGARRSTVVAHARGAVIRVGQSYSLVRAIPR